MGKEDRAKSPPPRDRNKRGDPARHTAVLGPVDSPNVATAVGLIGIAIVLSDTTRRATVDKPRRAGLLSPPPTPTPTRTWTQRSGTSCWPPTRSL
eukprot:2544162-Pleurochrysis_carterae.AAC.1